MDLLTVQQVDSPRARAELPGMDGAAFLAGGTWLFSEPQPGLRRLVDLAGLAWPPLEVSEAGLRIAATCTIAELERFQPPPEWRAGALFAQSCRALLGSFKVWEMATVGGNVCLALAAAPMLALTVALEGIAVIWHPDGSERHLPMAAFAQGPQQIALAPGELLRAIDLPLTALIRRAAFRQVSLFTHGRSAALLIGLEGFSLTVTASVPAPVYFAWPAPPSSADLDAALQPLIWYNDVHGIPAWRCEMTRRLATEIRDELCS